jgi:hypothetical protein
MTDQNTEKKVPKDVFAKRMQDKTVAELHAFESMKDIEISPKATKDDLIEIAYAQYAGLPIPDLEANRKEAIQLTDVIQGRVADQRSSFRRAGYVFNRLWTTLAPQPGPMQLQILKSEPAVRLRTVKE